MLLILRTSIYCFQSGIYQTPSYILSSGISLLSDSPIDFINSPSETSKGIESGLVYLYNEPELVIKALGSSYKLKKFGFGVALNNLNNDLINENHFTLNSSYCLSSFSLGVNLRIINQEVKGYDTITGVTTDIGMSWNWKQTTSSLTLSNLYPQKIDDIKLPFKTNIQFAYLPFDIVHLGLGIESEEDYPVQYSFSSKLKLTRALFFYSGYQTEVNRLNFGILINYKRVSFKYAVSNHPELELTHALGIQFNL